MRNFFGGLIGSKEDSANSVVKAVLRDLAGDGVADPLWAQILGFASFEDVFEENVQREELVALVTEHPENMVALVQRCVCAVEESAGKGGAELDEKAELALVNAATILAHVLAARPAQRGGEGPEGTEAAEAVGAGGGMGDLLWAAPPGEDSPRPLGERVVDAAMRLLFLEGFTLDSEDAKGEEDDAPGPPAQSTGGVDPTLLWHDGIGPAGCVAPEKVDDDVRSNRQLGLQLLAALLVGGAPADPAVAHRAEGSAPAAAEDAARRVVADGRPLAYLCDPGRPVPRRGEFFYSLASVALSYDPHGYGVPYAGYFSGAKDETFVSVSLQVMGLILQGMADLETTMGEAVVVRRPQQELGRKDVQALQASGHHVFREMLAGSTSETEVSFLVGGVVALLGTVSEERSTYFPSSMRLPPFLPELLVLVFHLAACEAFVRGVCAQGEAPTLVEGLLHAASAPEHVREDALALLAGMALLRLTAHREVCAALNEDFSGDVPDDLPEFQGTGCDLVMLAALKQASDSLAAGKAGRLHSAVVEVNLCIVANVSTYAEGLSMETCFRMFALFERCVKPVHLKRGRSGISVWLPHLLEAFSNIVQYQYGQSSTLVYGLMTRQAMLRDLLAFCGGGAAAGAEQAAAETEPGEGGPAAPDAGAAEMGGAWCKTVEALLGPIVGLLDAIVPQLESEVEKKDISSPEDAKALLPRCVLGLLPVPHPFITRNLRYNECSHWVCEQVLVACVGNGPAGSLWDIDDEDAEEDDDDAADDGGKAKAAAPKESAGRQRGKAAAGGAARGRQRAGQRR